MGDPQAPASREPTLAEAILEVIRIQIGKLLVARPGKIVDFDSTTSLATVKPLLANLRTNPDGSLDPAPLPEIPGVPVFFLGGGGLRITTPVVAGDIVQLIFCDRSLDEWKAAPTEESAPGDARRHAIGDAIAIVGCQVWTQQSDAAITIGADGGTFQGVGLGANLRTELNALWDAMYGGHTHIAGSLAAPSGGGPVTGVTGTSTGSPSKQTVDSATVLVTP